jgi:DNA-binding transcriptional MocR family regulator
MLRTGLDWDALLERNGRRPRASAIRDLLAVTERPEMISFAGGLPAPELFPAAGLRAAFDSVLRGDAGGALQYGPTAGHRPLRELVAERMAARGIVCDPEDVVITTGSQQALDLVGRVLAGPGMTVLVESPSYVGALQAFSAQQVTFDAVPMDDRGLRADALRARLAAGPEPALLYTVPTFQNPAGLTMALDRRHEVLACSRDHGLPVVEDDPYSELRYDGVHVPALRALPGGEDVIHLGTFSKVLSPGLRLGWVTAPRAVAERIVLAKQGADLHTDSLTQRAVVRFCRDNDLDAHVLTLRAAYRERRDAMLAALTDLMPDGVRWTRPEGGMFIWLTLPPGLQALTLLREAIERRVAFVPGGAFHAGGDCTDALRLNFTNSPPDLIREGVERLAAALVGCPSIV